MVVGAAAGGFADVHAASIGVASLVAGGRIAPDDAVTPVLVAFSTNAATKVALAYWGGTRRYGHTMLAAMILVVAGAWAGWLLA